MSAACHDDRDRHCEANLVCYAMVRRDSGDDVVVLVVFWLAINLRSCRLSLASPETVDEARCNARRSNRLAVGASDSDGGWRHKQLRGWLCNLLDCLVSVTHDGSLYTLDGLG